MNSPLMTANFYRDRFGVRSRLISDARLLGFSAAL